MRVIDKQTPDLVLLEALLPDEEGFEICRRIRRTSDVPIVFHSTKARAEDRVLGLKLGADDYLAKPCPPAELIARVGARAATSRAHPPAADDGARLRHLDARPGRPGMHDRRRRHR